MTSTTPYGVRLTLPGAPNEDHDVAGLHVIVNPVTPAPLETDEDVARAQALVDAGADIEIIELASGEPQLTGAALAARAAELNIEGRSSMTADELRAAIAAAEAELAAATTPPEA